MLNENQRSEFRKKLLEWYAANKRDLPWRRTGDPYKIWLSEIILQQTRVEQGMGYYQKFIEHYPRVQDLASAEEDEVLKLWQGLGYYSRARNLHASARQIVKESGGKFPAEYQGIKNLKGVGEYTAAAVSSIAYDLPYAAVDGNVYRVLSRVFGIATPIDSSKGKKEFILLAGELLDDSSPGEYNQALMEFGATHCKPKSPACHRCPFSGSCSALMDEKVDELPVKSKKLKQRKRYFNYLLVREKGSIFVRKRTKNDIWRNLYDFPLIETPESIGKRALMKSREWNLILPDTYEIEQVSDYRKHLLSHQKIHARFWEISCPDSGSYLNDNFEKVKTDRLSALAVPKLIDNYLDGSA